MSLPSAPHARLQSSSLILQLKNQPLIYMPLGLPSRTCEFTHLWFLAYCLFNSWIRIWLKQEIRARGILVANCTRGIERSCGLHLISHTTGVRHNFRKSWHWLVYAFTKPSALLIFTHQVFLMMSWWLSQGDQRHSSHQRRHRQWVIKETKYRPDTRHPNICPP